MQIEVRFKNTDNCEATTEFVVEKLSKLERFSMGKPQIVNVVFMRKGHSYAATFHYRHENYKMDSQALGSSFAAVSEQGIKKLLAQLSRNIEKAKSRHHQRRQKVFYNSADREQKKVA